MPLDIPRVLASPVNDDAALDGYTVIAKHMHFARAASETLARIVNRLLLCIGRCKRWLNTGSLKRNPRAFEFLTWPNFDDLHLQMHLALSERHQIAHAAGKFLERENRFADFIHRLDRLLEPCR